MVYKVDITPKIYEYYDTSISYSHRIWKIVEQICEVTGETAHGDQMICRYENPPSIAPYRLACSTTWELAVGEYAPYQKHWINFKDSSDAVLYKLKYG